MKKHSVHMVGNTHFDPVWLWTWDEAMASIRSTFRSALERMKEDKNFIYSFCTPPVFEWIKETDPEMFSEIKERAKEGRWDMAEGWWLQPDCSLALGESYVRQGLYGQRYLLENFGQITKSVFNADSFGHSAMLPQILKKSGIEYYTFCRPEKKEKEVPGPLFRWISPDGSEVLTYRIGGEGGEIYSRDVKKAVTDIGDTMETLGHDLMCVYGVSNHGGAPTKKAISEINALINDTEKGYDVTFSKICDFFSAQEKYRSLLPKVSEELIVKFFGVFINHNEVKKNSRRSEYMALNAEKAAVISYLAFKKPYPLAALTSCWKDILFNQFHDIIGGACIKNAYFDIRNQHGRALQTANEILHYNLQAVTRQIKMPGNNLENAWNLVLWNMNAFEVTEFVEAEVQWIWEFDWYSDGICLKDEEGTEYPCQIIREFSVIPGFRSRFVFKAKLPPLGYKTFAVVQTKKPVLISAPSETDIFILENACLTIRINPQTGGISSVYDKAVGQEILKDVLSPYCREDEGDTWAFNISSYGSKTEPFRLVYSKVIEKGPVRTTIKTKALFRDSFIEQYFTLYEGERFIDCRYRVNWNEKSLVLKLGTDTLSSSGEHTAAVPYGNVTRKNNGEEMPMGEWVSVTNENAGMSVLADSIFAYDMKDSVLSLSLLRSAIFGDLRLGPLDTHADYDFLGQGIMEGRVRILTTGQGKIPQKAISFNNPPIVIDEANHEGKLPSQGQYLFADSQSSLVTAVKLAEDGDGLILRLYEYEGKKDTVTLSLIPLMGKTTVTNEKYEIKTLKLGFDGSVNEVNLIEL